MTTPALQVDRGTRIEQLRRALSVLLAKQAEQGKAADLERMHIAADEALLWYIADDESIRLFDAIQKGYRT